MSLTAIEYGSRRLRLLEFEGSVKKMRVIDVVDVDLHVPPAPGDEAFDPDDTRAERIAEAVRESGFRRDPTGMALDASYALFREFDLPFTGDDQIRKVVRFEAESHLPISLEDAVIQHLALRKTRDKTHLLVAAVEKEFLLDRLDVLAEAGLDPMFVDLDVFALFHALVGTGLVEEHEHFAVVNAQEKTTSLLILSGGRLHAVRAIRLGVEAAVDGDDATEGEADDIHARDVREAHGHEYLARLEREIRRTVTTLPLAREFQAVYVTGSGSRVPGFDATIGRAFGCEAQTLDLLDRIDHELDDDEVAHYGADIGVALGIAYRMQGLDLTGTDFRREEVRYTKKFDQVKVPLVFLSFFVAGLVFFFSLEKYLEVKRLDEEFEKLLAFAQEQLNNTLDDVEKAEAVYANVEPGPLRVQVIHSAMENHREDLRKELGRSSTIPPLRSALRVWIELFDVLRRNEDLYLPYAIEVIDVETYRGDELTLSGSVKDNSAYQRLLGVLEEHPLFSVAQAATLRQLGTETRFENLVLTLHFDRVSGAPLGAEDA